MATYAYKELDAQRREIRLCILLPGSFEEPVACILSVVSLDDKLEYESLSYAWGSPILDKEIVISDCVHGSGTPKSENDTAGGNPPAPAPALFLDVTTSLYTAFRYLRKSDQTRVVCESRRTHFFPEKLFKPEDCFLIMIILPYLYENSILQM